MTAIIYSTEITPQRQQRIEKKLSRIVASTFFVLFSINVIHFLGAVFSFESELPANVCKGLLAVIFASGILEFISRVSYAHLGVIALTALIVIFQMLLFPANNVFFIETLTSFLLTCFPVIMYAVALREHKYVLSALEKLSVVMGIIALILFFIDKPEGHDNAYYMGLSNSCILPTIVLFNRFLKKSNIIHLILAVFVFLVSISYGSRGGTACVGIFIIASVLFGASKKTLLNDYKRLSIIAGLILLVIFFVPIVTVFYQTLEGMGISSRTLRLLVENDIFHTSDREIVYGMMLDEISKNLVAVRGINYDKVITSVGYAHNIALELLVEFGAIIALPILAFILYCAVKTVIFYIRDKDNTFLFMLMCSSVVILLWSSTLWTHTVFWTWLILIVKKLRADKKQKLKLRDEKARMVAEGMASSTFVQIEQ